MARFEVANLWVAIDGDGNNTVPKYGVTASEVAILQNLHGTEAVHNVKPLGFIERAPRVEFERLKAIYPKADDKGETIVDRMFPGANPRMFFQLNELRIVDEQFAAIARHGAGSARQAAAIAEAEAGQALVDQARANVPLDMALIVAPPADPTERPPVEEGDAPIAPGSEGADDEGDLDELPGDTDAPPAAPNALG